MRESADPVTAPADGPGPARPDRHEAARAALLDMAAAPHRWDFYQAMRLLEALHPDTPRFGLARRPVDEPVRLGQSPDLAFAPAAIAKVDPDDRGGKPRLEVRFFGLFGPNGPLPLHLTAYAHERALHRGDITFTRFADWFHHRLLLLFYRAWSQAQPTASLDRPGEDRFADYVGSLIGIGGPAWRDRDAAPDHAPLAFSGLLARQVRNAEGLERLLSGFLGRPVRVEPFVGRWMTLPDAERTRVGRRVVSRRVSTAQLGASAVLGRAVFDRQHHFRLHIGPLDLAAFESLLPVGQALPPLRALVERYLGFEFGWDLRLELAPEEVPRTQPGRRGRLGWTTWLGRPPAGRVPALNLVPATATP